MGRGAQGVFEEMIGVGLHRLLSTFKILRLTVRNLKSNRAYIGCPHPPVQP